MERGKYIITCPICGKRLFKSQSHNGCIIDVQCSKCGSYLNIKHVDCTLSVCETVAEYKGKETEK